MNVRALAVVAGLLLAFVSSTFADTAPPVPTPTPRTSSVGGGVNNPWRSPYKTAVNDSTAIAAVD